MTLPFMEQLMLMVDVPFDTGVPPGDHDVAFALVKKGHQKFSDDNNFNVPTFQLGRQPTHPPELK